MNNLEIAKILYEISEHYEAESIPFKPRAYHKVATAIEELDKQLQDIFQEQGRAGLLQIPGVGQGIAGQLEELLNTGQVSEFARERKKLPIEMSELRKVPGLGVRTAKLLYDSLGICNLEDLHKAVGDQKIREVSGLGIKSEKLFQAGLEFLEKQKGRYPLGQVWVIAEKLKKQLSDSQLFSELELVGSFRRRQDTVGNLSIVATSFDPQKAMDFFAHIFPDTMLSHRGVDYVSIRLVSGLGIDLRIVPADRFASTVLYFTGSHEHNLKLQKISNSLGHEWSAQGTQTAKTKFKNEAEIYNFLGMDFIPPEIRNDTGEIEAAKSHNLPKLLDYGDVVGDLQVQTDWTDGSCSIEQMAREAMRLGRKYIAITDHTKALAVTNGNDEKRLILQMKEIDKVNKKFKDFRVLKGAEVNILKDGSLDIRDQVLGKLDVVGVSVHTHFKMSKADMTMRISRALAHPHVNIFFHPTTRIVGRRPAIDFDFDKILKVAKNHHVALEINAHPGRLDLHDTLIRQGVTAGIKFTIDSDAHLLNEMAHIHFGEAQARRGWARKQDVLNTMEVGDLLKSFRK